MAETLNIQNLIEKAEQLVYDGKLQSAAYGEVHVQKIEYEDGSVYEIKVTGTFIPK